MAFDPFTHRKKLPAFPSVFGPVAALRNDPARMKSGFTGGGAVDAGYAGRVSAFNQNLYKPSDTRSTQETEQIYGRPAPAPITGWQAGSRTGSRSIEDRYRTPGTLPNAGLLGGGEFSMPDMPEENAASQTGLAGLKFPQSQMMQSSPDVVGTVTPSYREPGDEEDGAGNMQPPVPGSSISTTDRYYARQAARSVSRKSPQYGEARRFLRIDGSAPQSDRDNLRPPPVDFTQPVNGVPSKARGFGATPQDTSQEIQEGFERPGGAQWDRPMTYGDLRKKYQFGGGT